MSPTPTDPNQAQAWISGEAPDQTIDFYIPRGNTGIMGPQGPQGPSLSVGTVETFAGPAAPGTVGATGLTGPKGDPGGLVGTAITSGQDLNNFTASGYYSCGDGTFATQALNYPLQSKAGQLFVLRSHSNLIHQTYYVSDNPHAGRVQYHRTYISGSWTPWRAMNATRVDQSAGRAIYQWDDLNAREQLIYGDTGWRNITVSHGIAGLTGNVLIRRVGHVVEFNLNVAIPDGISGGTYLVGTFPAGFVPANFDMYGYTRPSAATTQVTYRITALGFQLSAPSWTANLGNLRVDHTFITDNAWPTSLPGTAHGSVPNT